MADEASTTGSAPGACYIVALAHPSDSSNRANRNRNAPDSTAKLDDTRIGGKARSLIRLAALGLPTPPALAVSGALWEALRAGGPPLPDGLLGLADVTALDTARRALEEGAFPPGFAAQLQHGLDRLDGAHRYDETAGAGAAGGASAMTHPFAVRSSGDTEDDAGALGAGIYASLLRVPSAEVAAAIRQVLASFLTPAAWAYRAARSGRQMAAGGENRAPAVLIHPFIEGTAAGAAAVESFDEASSDLPSLRIEVTQGALTPLARQRILSALRSAVALHGPVEVEWVAEEDQVIFLQMRAYRAGAPPASATRPATKTSAVASSFARLLDPQQSGGPWTWDAAHNPLPLSPAQAGLVEFVNERCRLGFEQVVRHGYLFFRHRTSDLAGITDPGAAVDLSENPAAALADLTVAVNARLAHFGSVPTLEEALELFVWAYAPLYAELGPACAAARRRLAEFVETEFADEPHLLPRLLAGVPSVARTRHQLALAISRSPAGDARAAAVEHYLHQFGDESPRWDVAEPTLREAPARLWSWLPSQADPRSTAGTPRSPDTAAMSAPDCDDTVLAERDAQSWAHRVRQRLRAAQQTKFDQLLTAARRAVAVGEDDDALFAQLQAVVRRALLAEGERLQELGRLDAAADVFFLPLPLVRAVAAKQDPSSHHDLRARAAEARATLRDAAASPPVLPARAATQRVLGQPGAPGQAVGRAVHHPAPGPLGPDAILFAATLLPTELPLLFPAAIVVETGHVLGHVAAQARERGLPAVVGAAGALAAIAPGARVLVDGLRGEVLLLDETS